ncbi:MAG TPA: MFS transporter [Acidobacteriaceae bacterium]|nr:MFS transporter [Acidobacteriaceae bacterium]
MPAPNIPRQTARSYLMVTACTGTFAFGTLVAFLGATLPELRARFGFDIAQGGTLISLLFLPQIPMSFVAGPLIDRFGKKPVLASGSLLCAVALATISVAPNYQVLAMLVFAVGLGGSCINSGSNTLVPDLYPVNPSAALNLANSFFSLGTVGFPVLVTLMARRFGLAPALVLVGVSNAIPGVLSLTQIFPAARSKGGLDWTLIRNALLNRSILLLALVIFLYSSLEASTAGWLRTYFEQEFFSSAQTSGGILVAFFASMLAGRLAASEITKRVRGPIVVAACAAGAVIGLIFLALGWNLQATIVAVVVTGLCYGPIFPTTAGITSSLFPEIFGTIFGLLMAAGFTGSMILPAAIGYVAKASTIKAGIWLLPISAFLLLVVQSILVRREKSGGPLVSRSTGPGSRFDS